MNVAVLGCGPSGLIAAHAALECGADVSIFSLRQKSPMPGAQFLHERIPGVTPYEPDGYIQLLKQGTGRGYAKKVYGSPDAPVSWDKYEDGFIPAWSLGDTYDKLWDAWSPVIKERHLTGQAIRKLSLSYDAILSSIPAPALCKGTEGCEFKGTHVWFTDIAWSGCGEDCIVYNGEEEIPWYRTSRLFGIGATEYATRPAQPSRHGFKPTETNCHCHPTNVIRIGRFGKWDKNTLVHDAYKDTKDALLDL